MDGGERRGGMSRDGHSTRNYESTKSVRGCRGCSQPNTPYREAFKKTPALLSAIQIALARTFVRLRKNYALRIPNYFHVQTSHDTSLPTPNYSSSLFQLGMRPQSPSLARSASMSVCIWALDMCGEIM